MLVSSPRPWGCFRQAGVARAARAVFPTPVGVFLRTQYLQTVWYSLPHARGGVSSLHQIAAIPFLSSPRPWGCFLTLSTHH